MKGWLRDRVADIACLSGRTDSGPSLQVARKSALHYAFS